MEHLQTLSAFFFFEGGFCFIMEYNQVYGDYEYKF